jgi:hypothetical protein
MRIKRVRVRGKTRSSWERKRGTGDWRTSARNGGEVMHNQ